MRLRHITFQSIFLFLYSERPSSKPENSLSKVLLVMDKIKSKAWGFYLLISIDEDKSSENGED